MEMQKFEVKFGEWIQSGFNLFKENAAVLIVANLIAMVLSVVTFGILAGPMLAGVIWITLQLRDKKEPKPKAGDVFKGFEYFLPAFLFVLVWGALLTVASLILMFIPCIGQIVQILLNVAAGPVLMFGLYLIVDRKMDFWPASMAGLEMAKANFLPLLALSVVAGAISSVGLLACFVGVIVSAPIGPCILATAYREIGSTVTPPVPTPQA